MTYKYELSADKIDIILSGLKKLPRKNSRQVLLRITDMLIKQSSETQGNVNFNLELTAHELDTIGLGLDELPMDISDNLFTELQEGFLKQVNDNQVIQSKKEISQKRSTKKPSKKNFQSSENPLNENPS